MKYFLTIYALGNNAQGVYSDLKTLWQDLIKWQGYKIFRGYTITIINK